MKSSSLLSIHSLRTVFATEHGDAAAVDGVSLAIEPGETLGLVGESGCGKTVTALSILRLLPPTARIADGTVQFEGRDLAHLSETELREVRGNDIAMIFQEPMSSLNPVFRVGEQIAESLRTHLGLSRVEARDRVVQLLELVEIPEAASRRDAYPHELSGGMRQRVMIAMALACKPRLLIADEPTTALDVTIQAQILDLIAQLQSSLGMAVLLVTHDLGIVAERAQHVAIMYAGRIVEQGHVDAVFAEPRHPYTQGLLRSLPGNACDGDGSLFAIPGIVPELWARPSGCRYRDRCPRVVDECARRDPQLQSVGDQHAAACLRLEDR